MATTRRRGRTYRMPSMFGDFYGGGAVQATIQGPSMIVPQTIIDGLGVNLFVVNGGGGQGADIDPLVPIQVLNGGPLGPLVAVSVGPGNDTNGDAQPDTYPISQPMNVPGAPPVPPGSGTLVYLGGNAFFPGPNPVGSANGWLLNANYQFTPNPVLVNLPAGGAAVRRIKVAENNSPLPRDRFIFNYNFFSDVLTGIGDVNRYTFGFEHTFLDELGSVELLAPFASTLSADQFANGTQSRDTEFGDLALIFKLLLYEDDLSAYSAGIGFGIPTGGDSRVFAANGPQIINLQHEGFHVLPYVAALQTCDSGWYWQSFVQLDVAASGNRVEADVTGANLQPVGTLQDQTLLFVDVGIGRWLTAPPAESDGGPAVAATAEIHYSTTLNNADVVQGSGLSITSQANRYDVVNLTLGASVLLNDRFTIRPAMVVPLSGDDDRQFDYEAMVQMNYWR